MAAEQNTNITSGFSGEIIEHQKYWDGLYQDEENDRLRGDYTWNIQAVCAKKEEFFGALELLKIVDAWKYVISYLLWKMNIHLEKDTIIQYHQYLEKSDLEYLRKQDYTLSKGSLLAELAPGQVIEKTQTETFMEDLTKLLCVRLSNAFEMSGYEKTINWYEELESIQTNFNYDALKKIALGVGMAVEDFTTFLTKVLKRSHINFYDSDEVMLYIALQYGDRNNGKYYDAYNQLVKFYGKTDKKKKEKASKPAVTEEFAMGGTLVLKETVIDTLKNIHSNIFQKEDEALAAMFEMIRVKNATLEAMENVRSYEVALRRAYADVEKSVLHMLIREKSSFKRAYLEEDGDGKSREKMLAILNIKKENYSKEVEEEKIKEITDAESNPIRMNLSVTFDKKNAGKEIPAGTVFEAPTDSYFRQYIPNAKFRTTKSYTIKNGEKDEILVPLVPLYTLEDIKAQIEKKETELAKADWMDVSKHSEIKPIKSKDIKERFITLINTLGNVEVDEEAKKNRTTFNEFVGNNFLKNLIAHNVPCAQMTVLDEALSDVIEKIVLPEDDPNSKEKTPKIRFFTSEKTNAGYVKATCTAGTFIPKGTRFIFSIGGIDFLYESAEHPEIMDVKVKVKPLSKLPDGAINTQYAKQTELELLSGKDSIGVASIYVKNKTDLDVFEEVDTKTANEIHVKIAKNGFLPKGSIVKAMYGESIYQYELLAGIERVIEKPQMDMEVQWDKNNKELCYKRLYADVAKQDRSEIHEIGEVYIVPDERNTNLGQDLRIAKGTSLKLIPGCYSKAYGIVELIADEEDGIPVVLQDKTKIYRAKCRRKDECCVPKDTIFECWKGEQKYHFRVVENAKLGTVSDAVEKVVIQSNETFTSESNLILSAQNPKRLTISCNEREQDITFKTSLKSILQMIYAVEEDNYGTSNYYEGIKELPETNYLNSVAFKDTRMTAGLLTNIGANESKVRNNILTMKFVEFVWEEFSDLMRKGHPQEKIIGAFKEHVDELLEQAGFQLFSVSASFPYDTLLALLLQSETPMLLFQEIWTDKANRFDRWNIGEKNGKGTDTKE